MLFVVSIQIGDKFYQIFFNYFKKKKNPRDQLKVPPIFSNFTKVPKKGPKLKILLNNSKDFVSSPTNVVALR